MSIKSCEIVQQLDFLKYDLCEFEKRIKQLSNLKSYCFIVHDKDLDENGKSKKPHLHCVLTFNESTQFSVLSNALDIPVQYFNHIRNTVKTAKAYLIHLNDKNKHQYNCSDVKSNFDYETFIDKLTDDKKKPKKEEIAEKISNGEIKEYNLLSYITCDDYARNKPYYTKCFEYRQNTIATKNRDLQCVFISGKSGAGKTTFAKDYANSLGYSVYVTSSGNNLFDDYKGQECIIIDDLRFTQLSFSDLLKITDNNTNSLVACRFYNRSIFECKLLIITCCLSIKDFYKSYNNYESSIQLYRRFGTYIYIDDYINFYSYYNNDYVYLYKTVNYIRQKYIKSYDNKFNNIVDIAQKMELEIVPDFGQFVEFNENCEIPL